MLLNCCWIVNLKALESPLDSKEIKPIDPKGNKPWKFIGRTVAKAEDPMLWPPDVKSWLIRKELTHWKRPSFWGRPKTKGEGVEEKIDSITNSMDTNVSKLWETVEVRGAWWAYGPWSRKQLDPTQWLKNNNPPGLWSTAVSGFPSYFTTTSSYTLLTTKSST